MIEHAETPQGDRALPILLYHAIGDAPPEGFRPYTVSTAQWRRHLAMIEAGGFTTLSVEQIRHHLLTGAPLPPRAVGLTIDDGLEDFFTNGLTPLLERGFNATLYVVSGFLGGTSGWLHSSGAGTMPMVDADQLREIHRAGVEIGSHTVTHPELDNIAPRRAWWELRESRRHLEELLDAEVTSFAYPHGHFTRHLRDLVIAAGYRSATGVRNMMSHRRDHLFSLARITILADITDAQFAQVLAGGGGYRRAPARELLRTAAARQKRRLTNFLR